MMQSKDILAFIFLGAILAVVGIVLVQQFGGGASERTAQLEVVRTIDADFNEDAARILREEPEAAEQFPIKRFSDEIDVERDLGNDQPFANRNQ